MTVFDKIRERSAFVSFFVKLQNSVFFPALCAVICVISGVSPKEVYLPCIWFIAVLSTITVLFSDDLKVFIAPVMVVFYAIGMDVTKDYFAGYNHLPPFDLAGAAPHFIAGACLLLAALIYKLFAMGIIREMFVKRGIFFWGIIFIDAALLLNGVLSLAWNPINLLYGVIIALSLTLCYCLFVAILSRSKDGIAYTCKALIATALAVSAQVLIIAYRLHLNDNLFITLDSGALRVNRVMLAMGWGFPTTVGAVIALAIPAALYLAHSRRFPILSYVTAAFLWGMTLFIDTRSAILFGCITLIGGVVFCCISGKNKKINRIFTLLTLGVFALTLIALLIFNFNNFLNIFNTILHTLRLDFGTDSTESFAELFGSRADIWLEGLRGFLRAPLFGAGFMHGDFGIDMVYSNMHHNIFIEFLGSMGLLGLLALLIHLRHCIEVLIRRFSLDKLLLLGVPLSLLGMSLLDNFFFYPNFIIIYTAFLACAEVLLESRRAKHLGNIKKLKAGEKPRVVFTFIEAGKGHIIPTRTVCDAFKKKYGDKVEVVESKFFTETGNPDMEKTEALFTKAVKQQNRSPILSFLCKLGNLIAGDNFALQVLLSFTISGKKTAPLAIRHVEELDANLVYTAHWATPYYINRMKTPRPYTICFCPDVYSNGAFNVDCNNFLISSDCGYRQLTRMRMYAGGNITKIPFPSRPEIDGLRELAKDKAALRRELGISETNFTVSLSDGGYGVARLGDTVKMLKRYAGEHNAKLTVLAFCGTNEKLRAELSELCGDCPDNMTLIPFGFCTEIVKYIAASDLYVGKSGANSIAEPASLGVPIIVSKCATYIETGIKNYYVRSLKGAMYIPNAKRVAKKVLSFADDPSGLDSYRKNLMASPTSLFDAEASADLIWQRLCELEQSE